MSGSEPPVDTPTGDGDPDPGDGGEGSRRTRRIALAVGLVVLVLVAAAAAILVLNSDDEAVGYDDETRAAFLAACTGDGGDEVADVCACIYDGIEADIPYDRFAEVDEQLTERQEADPDALVEELPDDFDVIRATCVEEVGPVATTTTEAPTTTQAPASSEAPTTTQAPASSEAPASSDTTTT